MGGLDENRQGSDVCGRGRGPPHPPIFVKKSDRSGLGRESESRRPPAAAAAVVAAPAAPEIRIRKRRSGAAWGPCRRVPGPYLAHT